MKERKYTSGITIFFGAELYAQLSDEAHRRQISRSQLVREALSVHLRHNDAGRKKFNDLLEKAEGFNAGGE